MLPPAQIIKNKIGPVLKQRRVRRWGLGLLIGMVLLLALSWLAVPHFVNQIATEQVQRQLGRKLRIGELSFSPFRLALTANDVSLYEPDQTTPMLTIKSVVMNLSLSSLFRQALVMDEIRLVSPSVHIVRTAGDGYGRYNFSDILERIAAMPKSTSDKPFRFSLANIQLQDGGVQFDDKVVDQHVKVEALHMALPFLSNFPSSVTTYVSPFLSARVNGTLFSLQGRTKPFDATLDTALALDVEQLDLASYVAYSPVPLPVKLRSASLTTKLDLVFSRKKEQPELLLSGDISLKNLAIDDKDAAPLLRTKAIATHIRQLNIFSGAAAIEKLLIAEPEVWLALDDKGELNWARLSVKPANAAKTAGKASPAKDVASADASKPAVSSVAAAQPLPVSLLTELIVQKGIVHWSDAANAAPAQELTLKNVSVNAKQLSTQANAKPANISVTANGEHDEALSFQGELQPVTASVSGQAELRALALADYQPYINKVLAANLGGLVTIKSRLSSGPSQFKLEELSAAISDFKLSPKDKAGKTDGGIAIKSFSIDKLSLDTEARSVQLENVAFDGVRADIRRDQQAQLNLQKIVLNKAAASTPAAANTHTSSAAAKDSWKTSVHKIAFTDSSVDFTDNSVAPAVSVKTDGIRLDIENASSDLASQIAVALQATINRKGKLALKGNIAPGIKAVTLELDGQDLPVAKFYPYFSEFMNATLTRGQASAKGKFSVSNPTVPSRQIAYDGTLKLANFHLLENGASDDFLEWKAIDLDGISARITADQPQVSLKKLTLTDFYARAILSDQGKLNLQNIFVAKNAAPEAAAASAAAAPVEKKTDAKIEDGGLVISGSSTKSTGDASAAKPAAAGGKQPVIRIAQTVIKGGNINFTDHFVKPNYSANLTGLAGSIGAIASDNPQAAAIDLSGKIDNDAPLLISGTLNPLAKPLFLDIKGSANGIELTRLTPYAAKYAGYAIEKGKLSMQVAYHVENQNLQAVNDVRIDQLTFGDRIDSPDATKLPVMLAVALLRDNNGQISVNLPVSGSLSDPQFSVGGLIFKVFVNLITKAVTAPFSLLASAFGGGGEELSYIEFKPGQSALAPETTGKLDNLAKALKNRSGLKLDIIGRVDPASDTEGLRRESLVNKMKALKLKDLRRAGTPGTTEEVTLDDADRKKYMEEVYSSEKFSKPRNVIGIAKTLPTDEAERLILSNTPVTPEALRALAQARADTVRDYLEQKGEVGKDRLFLIAPRLTAEGIKDKGATTRVDFSLK
ncbi:MAG: DUF748 domain-containing protein [Pseudomonadota bacterium]